LFNRVLQTNFCKHFRITIISKEMNKLNATIINFIPMSFKLPEKNDLLCYERRLEPPFSRWSQKMIVFKTNLITIHAIK